MKQTATALVLAALAAAFIPGQEGQTSVSRASRPDAAWHKLQAGAGLADMAVSRLSAPGAYAVQLLAGRAALEKAGVAEPVAIELQAGGRLISLGTHTPFINGKPVPFDPNPALPEAESRDRINPQPEPPGDPLGPQAGKPIFSAMPGIFNVAMADLQLAPGPALLRFRNALGQVKAQISLQLVEK